MNRTFETTWLAVLLVGAPFFWSSVARADVVSDWIAHREQQKQTYDAQIAQDTLVPTSGISEILQIHVENSRALTLRTRLPTTSSRAENSIVKLSEPDRFAIVHIRGGSDDENRPAVVPEGFMLTTTDFSKSREYSTVNVNALTTAFSISKSVVAPGNYLWIQLMQQSATDEPYSPGLVQLVVNQSTNGTLFPMSLQAEDFWTLVHRYPKEGDQYIRPLLRELGQESAYAPDPLIAWQVFADLWRAEPAARAKVAKILPTLDDPAYRKRNEAVQALVRLGKDAAAVLVHLDRTRLSAEQNAQIDRALIPFTQLSAAEAVRMRSDTSFLLDCMYAEDETLRSVASRRLDELLGPAGHVDPESPAPVRELAIAAVRKTITGK